MQAAPRPADDRARIATLRLLNILDTEPEERFDRLTRMARRLFSVPIALVTLVDADRQWFKSNAGLAAAQTSRDVSFCGHAILADDILLVPDARQDERFLGNPLVEGDPRIRFYAGCPLKVGAHNLGTLCVIDDKPRIFGDEERQLLKDLANMAQQELTALQLAFTDHLTAISNRRGFEALARHSLLVCETMSRPASLLLFDLDKFKMINDVHGHAVGDRALKLFAQGLIAVFRDGDVIARLGGDEFVVLMTGATMSTVDGALARLEDWLRENGRIPEMECEIEFSAGHAAFHPGENESIDVLLSRADSAMYACKHASSR